MPLMPVSERTAGNKMALVRRAPETMGLLKVSVAKQATIETELAAHLPAVRANSALIWQLVMNFVTAARIGSAQYPDQLLAPSERRSRNPELRDNYCLRFLGKLLP